MSDGQVISRHLAAMNRVAWGTPKLKVKDSTDRALCTALTQSVQMVTPPPSTSSEDVTLADDKLLDDVASGYQEQLHKDVSASQTDDLSTDVEPPREHRPILDELLSDHEQGVQELSEPGVPLSDDVLSDDAVPASVHNESLHSIWNWSNDDMLMDM